MKRPAPLRLLWQQHRPTVVISALALVVALVFAARFAVHAVYWHQTQGGHPPLEPWMTFRFVSHAWEVPPDQVLDALHIPDTQRRQTLEDIAHAQNRPVGALISDLTATLGATK